MAPAGYGTALAVELARAAERAGADAILLLPHYLSEAGQAGLEAHVRTVCRSTDLGVIIYNRANARYDATTVENLAADCPNLIGFKDGVGDIEQMTRIYSRLGDRLLYVGGLPTAEMYALPYLKLGLTTYSSAIFNFAAALGARLLRRGAWRGRRARRSPRSTSSCSRTATCATGPLGTR